MFTVGVLLCVCHTGNELAKEFTFRVDNIPAAPPVLLTTPPILDTATTALFQVAQPPIPAAVSVDTTHDYTDTNVAGYEYSVASDGGVGGVETVGWQQVSASGHFTFSAPIGAYVTFSHVLALPG